MPRHSFEQIRELLSYDPSAGELRWRVSRGRMSAGQIAGHVKESGYVVVNVSGSIYRAHRLAWLLSHGEWPAVEIDHRNGAKTDNRLINLRAATRSQNEANKPVTRANTSGFKGVMWDPRLGKWRAEIRRQGRKKYLGSYSDVREAAAAYQRAAQAIYQEFANFG